MTSPVLALRGAILDAAAADAELCALMGGSLRLYDEPPRGAAPVYALFSDVRAADWSTDRERGHEQSLGIVVWSEPGGARTALAVAERLDAILDDAALTLDGHRLVNLRVTEISGERDKDTRLTRVTLRLRAVTEVA
ncbi:DUF3168 domain-containing protein [Microvirga terrae]|uniref:DUF3168 domain-containing protein n=1 Tax=Microvirga terrae TaxID=2740529 RepID=A0ABY5RMK8_9HYPH|nr:MULTISPECIES: DUF3168 domain-containing protein [Microvirga]MBQ0822286.1 DUF3168 domain-containing protein [Microvirga sp. HBU67558]UVF18238.1 DUF3168 domain-containing protein [Microvirga terrae]